MISKLVYKSMKFLDAERSHNLAKWGMKRKLLAPGICSPPGQSTSMFDFCLPNPLGLAAGFDKNGELVDVVQQYGFGFVEVGSVTYRGGKGNPRPRMFRIEPTNRDCQFPNNEKNYDILNRMGLNGDPACVVAQRLSRCKSHAFGVNIAKTHDLQIVGDAAIRDVVESYQLLKTYGMYTVINISCPNTAEGKTFERVGPLRELLASLPEAGARPLMVKLSPVFIERHAEFLDILDVCEEFAVAGYVISNTVPYNHPTYGKGGRSGLAVHDNARALVACARKHVPTKLIHGVGGIFTSHDVFSFTKHGADFFQAYNGFVHGPRAGVDFAHKILNELVERYYTAREPDPESK